MNVYAEVRVMAKMPMADLKARYAELFGEQTRSGNRDYLVRRIAWRLQARAEGDLSERARKRAAELADDADLLPHPGPSRRYGFTRSTVFGPMPGTLSRSSIDLKPPLCVRKSTMALAVAGPMPGRSSSSAWVAALRSRRRAASEGVSPLGGCAPVPAAGWPSAAPGATSAASDGTSDLCTRGGRVTRRPGDSIAGSSTCTGRPGVGCSVPRVSQYVTPAPRPDESTTTAAHLAGPLPADALDELPESIRRVYQRRAGAVRGQRRHVAGGQALGARAFRTSSRSLST